MPDLISEEDQKALKELERRYLMDSSSPPGIWSARLLMDHSGFGCTVEYSKATKENPNAFGIDTPYRYGNTIAETVNKALAYRDQNLDEQPEDGSWLLSLRWLRCHLAKLKKRYAIEFPTHEDVKYWPVGTQAKMANQIKRITELLEELEPGSGC